MFKKTGKYRQQNEVLFLPSKMNGYLRFYFKMVGTNNSRNSLKKSEHACSPTGLQYVWSGFNKGEFTLIYLLETIFLEITKKNNGCIFF